MYTDVSEALRLFRILCDPVSFDLLSALRSAGRCGYLPPSDEALRKSVDRLIRIGVLRDVNGHLFLNSEVAFVAIESARRSLQEALCAA